MTVFPIQHRWTEYSSWIIWNKPFFKGLVFSKKAMWEMSVLVGFEEHSDTAAHWVSRSYSKKLCFSFGELTKTCLPKRKDHASDLKWKHFTFDQNKKAWYQQVFGYLHVDLLKKVEQNRPLFATMIWKRKQLHVTRTTSGTFIFISRGTWLSRNTVFFWNKGKN